MQLKSKIRKKLGKCPSFFYQNIKDLKKFYEEVQIEKIQALILIILLVDFNCHHNLLGDKANSPRGV